MSYAEIYLMNVYIQPLYPVCLPYTHVSSIFTTTHIKHLYNCYNVINIQAMCIIISSACTTPWHNICHDFGQNTSYVSIKLQDTPTLIHHLVLEIVEINIFFISEEAMFENWRKLVSLSKIYSVLEKIQSYIVSNRMRNIHFVLIVGACT